ENFQLAVVMRNVQFTSIWDIQAMSLKAGQTIEGIWNGCPAPNPSASTSAPATNPNTIDLLAFQRTPNNRLSDAMRACWVQLNLCFCCGQARHISRGCSKENRKYHGFQKPLSSAWISELQAKINRIHATQNQKLGPNP
ncbi:uncharacterized protein VP01_11058g1, partial [Puccinia sorghi]